MTPRCLVVRAGSCEAGDCIHLRGRSHRPMLASTPYNRHASARFDCQKGYADTPTIRNALSLSFPFRSPGDMEAGWCGVERRSSVQERSEIQAQEATMLQCLALEVREGFSLSFGEDSKEGADAGIAGERGDLNPPDSWRNHALKTINCRPMFERMLRCAQSEPVAVLALINVRSGGSRGRQTQRRADRLHADPIDIKAASFALQSPRTRRCATSPRTWFAITRRSTTRLWG